MSSIVSPSKSDQYTDIFLGKKNGLLGSSNRYNVSTTTTTTTTTGTTFIRTTSPTITLTTDIPRSNKDNTELYRRNNYNEAVTTTKAGSLKMESDATPPGSIAFSMVPLTVPKWYHLSTRWIVILSLIVMTSMGALIVVIDSFMYYQKDTTSCGETYMRPLYLKQDGFDDEMTRFAGKYALYLYREKGVDLVDQPTGIPVLFIPGHAGSYKQIRSIAAESSYYYYQNYARNADTWDQGMRHLDFFTVDFNEEFSALHGQSLLEQAEYLNDAIDYILKLYPLARKWGPQQNNQLPDPTSVIILGHSMGGIVARTMFTLHNYQPGTINTLITLSTPHILPPAPFDWKISKIYDDIHLFWKNGYESHQQRTSLHSQHTTTTTTATITSSINSTDILKDVILISIAGGNLDSMICSDSTNVGPFLPQSHGFTIFSTAIPYVWTGADHVSILSCNQLVKSLSKTILNIVDARRGSQTKPIDERIKIMKKAFLSGLEDRQGDGSDLELGDLAFYDLKPNQSRFLLPGQRLILDKSDEHDIERKMVFLPVYEGADALALLTSYPMGKHEPFDLLLCNKLEMRIKGTTRMGCRTTTNGIVVPIPASTSRESTPSSGNTFNFASVSFEEMLGYEFLAVVDRRGLGDFGVGKFLIAESYDFDTNTKTIKKSMLDISLGGIHVDLSPALFSNIRIPAIESSMLAYHVNVLSPRCSSTHFLPLLRQSISSMHESKFYVNVGREHGPIDVSVHGRTAFSAISPPIRSHHAHQHQQLQSQYDAFSENNPHGLDISIWMDPSCNQPIKLDLTVDWYGSFGRIGFRNGIMLPTFAFIVVMVVWVAQIRCYFSTGVYPHFGQSMIFCLRLAFPVIATLLAMASVYQAWTDDEAYQLLDDSRLIGQWWKRYVSDSSYSNEIRSSMAIVWNDVLAGRTDLFFWWLPLCGLFLSIGVVCFLWLFVSFFIQLCASIVTLLLRYYPSVSLPKATKSYQPYPHHPLGGVNIPDHGLFWFIPNDTNMNRQRMERRIITTLILFSLVATCIPYQFVFLVAFLVHIITCVRSLMKLWIASPAQELERNNRYHFLQSILLFFITLLPFNAPILVVWIRNLSVHWFVPFSSDHSVLAIAPFMIYVEMLTNQKLMLPRMSSRIWPWLTYCVFCAVVVYAFTYGIKYTHSLYFLSIGLVGWLLFLHFWHSSYGQHLYYSIRELIYHYSFSKKKS